MILYNNVLQKHFKYTSIHPVYTKLLTGDKILIYHLCFPSTAELGKACQCLDVVERFEEEKLNLTEKLFDRKLQAEHFLFLKRCLLFDFF